MKQKQTCSLLICMQYFVLQFWFVYLRPFPLHINVDSFHYCRIVFFFFITVFSLTLCVKKEAVHHNPNKNRYSRWVLRGQLMKPNHTLFCISANCILFSMPLHLKPDSTNKVFFFSQTDSIPGKCFLIKKLEVEKTEPTIFVYKF